MSCRFLPEGLHAWNIDGKFGNLHSPHARDSESRCGLTGALAVRTCMCER